MPNPTTTDSKITGRATLGLRDIYAAAFWAWSARARWVYGISLVLIIMYTLWIDDVRDMDDFYESGLALLAVMLILGIFAWLGLLAVFVARMSPEQENIDYEIGQENIAIRDAAGTTFIKPWTQVKACHEHKSGFSLRLRPMGSHWLVKRAFAPSELESFRALTTSIFDSARRPT